MTPYRVSGKLTLSKVIDTACKGSLRYYDADQRNYAFMHFFNVLKRHAVTREMARDKKIQVRIRGAMSHGREYFERAMRELDPDADLSVKRRIRMRYRPSH